MIYDPKSDIEAVIERIDEEISSLKAQIDRLLDTRARISGALIGAHDYQEARENIDREEREEASLDLGQDPIGGRSDLGVEQETQEAPGDKPVDETGDPSSQPADEAPVVSQEPALSEEHDWEHDWVGWQEQPDGSKLRWCYICGARETEGPIEQEKEADPGAEAEEKARPNEESKAAKPKRRQLTAEQLRDFIVDDLTPRLEADRYLFIRGRSEVGKQGKAPGYFTVSDLAEELGFAPSGLYVLMPKIAHILESTSYKAGKQFRYVAPEVKAVRIAATKESSNAVKDPVPGTGKKAGHPKPNSNDVLKFLKSAKDQGYMVQADGRGHIRVTNRRSGKWCVVTTTPSDVNAVHQVRRDLVKLGVKLL